MFAPILTDLFVQDEAERNRLANRGQKRSVLGAGIGAAREVLYPGQKTPYSPRHVMTPHGPMVLAPEGPVPPSQHPFVQEQMLTLKCVRQVMFFPHMIFSWIKLILPLERTHAVVLQLAVMHGLQLTVSFYLQYPELAHMNPEVVKAATLRFELGLDPDVLEQDDDSDDEDPPPKPRPSRNIVWGEGVAATDGNSAQRLHEVQLVTFNARLLCCIMMIVCVV